MAAGDRGIYVSIMLFQGWAVHTRPSTEHPFHITNNINGIYGDVDGDGRLHEIHTLLVPAITRLQKAYVQKVIDTVNDLDNVLYEISNESGPYSTAWQYDMINYIRTYEAGKAKQHPVGMTAHYANNYMNAALFNSPADWISPTDVGSTGDYSNSPPAADGRKVILVDTDHLTNNVSSTRPGAANGAWVWKSFLRGLNPIYMDVVPPLRPPGTHWEAPYADEVRRNMGYTLTYAKRINLATMTPQNNLSSTQYMLADLGSEYVIYQPLPNTSFSVNLWAGTYKHEWFNPRTGTIATTGTVTARGGDQSFAAPFSGDAVLYLSVIGGPTPSLSDFLLDSGIAVPECSGCP
jgi:hypothetical protein